MSADPPIVCSLNAGELPPRLAEMAALGEQALLGARHDGAAAELRFATRAGVRERVDALVAAEAQCCGFLAIRVSETPDMVILRIHVPQGAEHALTEVLHAFGAQPPAGA